MLHFAIKRASKSEIGILEIFRIFELNGRKLRYIDLTEWNGVVSSMLHLKRFEISKISLNFPYAWIYFTNIFVSRTLLVSMTHENDLK